MPQDTKRYGSQCVQCLTLGAFSDHCLECGESLCAECPRTLGDDHYCGACYPLALNSVVLKNRTVQAFRKLHHSAISALEAA
jgi:hypothetical protein